MTAKDHDRMLEVLRSLTTPREPSKAEGAPEEPGRSWPHGEGERASPATRAEPLRRGGALAEEAPQIAPSRPADSRPLVVRNGAGPDASCPVSGGRVIHLRVEEVGLFFLAGVVLVVMAFLMGWYGRGTGAARPPSPRLRGTAPSEAPKERRGARPVVDSRRDAFSGAAREPASEMDSSPGRDLGTRPSRVRRAPARSGGAYSILVARFPPGGAGDAEDHRLFLEQRGYPARTRPTAEGIELCVGSFGSRADGLARQWLPKLRRLSPAYSSACIVRVP